MPKLTERPNDALYVRDKEYLVWDDQLKDFGGYRALHAESGTDNWLGWRRLSPCPVAPPGAALRSNLPKVRPCPGPWRRVSDLRVSASGSRRRAG